jgi:hypothetical protein
MAVGAGGSGSVHVGVVGVVDSHHERHPTAAIHPIHLPAHNLRVASSDRSDRASSRKT